MPPSDDAVKPGRDAAPEQARTRLSRRAVVDAAGVLFAERGYAATTVEAVADGAGVPVATVYRLFGSKIGILKGLLDAAIGGDDAPVAVADRAPVARLATETDPAALVAGFVAVAAGINARSNAIYGILAGAALTDPAAADLFAEMQRQRGSGQRRLAAGLARLGGLRDGLTEARAADVVHALMSPEVYRMLVVERRWSARRYRDWLTDTLRQQLLAQ